MMVLRQQDEFPPVPATTDLPGDWEDGVFYPSSDGLPMGENDAHIKTIVWTVAKFETWARRNRHDLFIAANMFYYWEQGNPRATIAPDIFVVRGAREVPDRTSYRLWHEHVVPAVAFEFLSMESERRDVLEKPRLYERIGIPEYFMYDPLGRLMSPRLQGYRLAGSRYVRLLPDAEGWMLSEQLGVHLKAEANELLLRDAATGKMLLRPNIEADMAMAEAAQARAEAARIKAEAEAERARREEAEAQSEAYEAELIRLREENARLRGEQRDQQ